MDTTPRLTAEQFLASRLDLPDAGRWTELVEGRIETLDPPDLLHGTIVLNLSKAVAAQLQPADETNTGYFCYELGLVVARDPDTIRFPAMSYVTRGSRFAAVDELMTDAPPALVVEIPSTNRRRRDLQNRVDAYLAWGVETVWVADPLERQVLVFDQSGLRKRLAERQMLEGGPLLGDCRIPVAELFAEPKWWTG